MKDCILPGSMHVLKDSSLEPFLEKDLRRLKKEESNSLEGPITYDELLKCLKKAKNNESPGSDGFMYEFYKFFWKDLSPFLLRSFNYSFANGYLSVTQRQGIITCIPK